MGRISVADIVFVTFPFSDLSQTKLRPALVLALADEKQNDWLLCQITSKNYNDDKAFCINKTDYAKGELNRLSYVRPNKLFTANAQIIQKNVATLKPETHHKIIAIIQQLLNDGK